MLTEDREQELLFRWLEYKGIDAFHVPNGGRRSPAEAAHFKRLGVRPGVPDVCIPIPRGDQHGLWIEMKRQKGGRLSEAQREWIEKLRSLGYRAEVCAGADEAIKTVEEYLG